MKVRELVVKKMVMESTVLFWHEQPKKNYFGAKRVGFDGTVWIYYLSSLGMFSVFPTGHFSMFNSKIREFSLFERKDSQLDGLRFKVPVCHIEKVLEIISE